MSNLKVKWPVVVIRNDEPYIGWVDLCNGTMFRIVSFFTSPHHSTRFSLFIGIERIGCFLFDTVRPKSFVYIEEKLNVSESDARALADWINAQLEVEYPQQGVYERKFMESIETYALGADTPMTPLIPEIINELEMD